MIALDVVVLRVLLYSVAYKPLSQRDDLCQTLSLDRASESLCVGFQIRAARRKPHGLDARRFQDLAKRLCEQTISVVNEVASFFQEAPVAIGEITRLPNNLVAEVMERSSDSDVASARILARHSEGRIPDLDCGSRATRPRLLLPLYFLAIS